MRSRCGACSSAQASTTATAMTRDMCRATTRIRSYCCPMLCSARFKVPKAASTCHTKSLFRNTHTQEKLHSRTFSCDTRSAGREKVKFGVVIAVACVRHGNAQIEHERKGRAVVVPEGSGSSAPLANANIKLAFLLASAKVTGDWPVELPPHVTTRAHDWRRNTAFHLPESILVPSVPAHTVTRRRQRDERAPLT